MNIPDLVNDLRQRGVHLWADGEQLRFRAPQGVLTAELREQLTADKPAVLEYLARDQAVISVSADSSAAHEPFPLTPVQRAYLIGRDPTYPYGGVACASYLEISYDGVDPGTVEKAWNVLVRRHDMLRATVRPDGYQQVAATAPHYDVPVTDVRGKSGTEVDAVLDRQRDALLGPAGGTDTWPLFALRTTRTDTACILHLVVELLVVDAASIQLLLAELDELVHASGEDTVLRPAPGIGFRDYVLGAQQLRNGSRYQRDRDYWQERIDTLPAAPELPTRSVEEDTANADPGFDRLHHWLPASVLEGLAGKATPHGLTPSGAVLAAYAEVIGRWSRKRQFTLNLPVFNRLPVHDDIGAVIGDFTSVNLLGVDLDEQDTFVDRARAITARLFADLDHRLFDGVDVLSELTRRAGNPVLMPVVFTSTLAGQDAGGRKNRGRILRGITRTPQVWLDCQVTPYDDGLMVAWDVRRGVLAGDTAADAFAVFVDLITRLADSPDAWTERYPVALPPEQRSRRAGYNDTAADIAPRVLHQRILDRADADPEAPAIFHRDDVTSFGELRRRVGAVAGALRESGVQPGDRVAVVMEKGPEQVVAALAVTVVGAAYVPIAITQPMARRERIIGRAGIEVALTQSWLRDADEVPTAVRRIAVDLLRGIDTVPEVADDPDAPAYVIYTSGSTGEPKGVVVTHRSAANTIDDINERFALTPHDRVLGVASLAFDLSVWDIFGVLGAGGAIVLPEQGRAADPSHWLELVQQHSVTLWNSVPGQLQMLLDVMDSTPDARAESLRLVLLSGDWIPLDLPDRMRAHHPDLTVVGLGGATEAAIWSIHHPVDRIDPRWRSVPYGVPLRNQSMHVLDAALQECPELVTGEIYIGGAGLAEEYLGDEELTAQRFIRHPRSGARLYRTGDLGRFHPDGHLEFLGREDTQVKIRGYRVELGEVESALRRHPAVADAAVLIDGRGPGARLHGFAEIATAEQGFSEPDTVDVLTVAENAAAAAHEEIDGESFVALMRAVDEMAMLSIAAQLRSKGLFADRERAHDIAEIATATGVSDRQHGLLKRWLGALADGGAVVHDPDTDRYSGLVEADLGAVEAAWRRIDELEEIVGYGSETLSYIRSCSSRLDELLRGELDVRELLFPAGKPGAAHAVYRTNLVARSSHRVVIDTVREIARQSPHRLRILEVGAGIAGTSTDLIPALAEFEPDYQFTDLSEYFLGEARKQFAEYPWVRYGRFDINADAMDQGLRHNSADVILCANVLHNSVNADEVLARLRDLLAPGGWLVFLEPTRQHNYALLVSMEFEFFSELTAFTDVRAGTGQAFFTRDQWLRQLDNAGADHVRVLPAEDAALAASGQGVFLARFKGERHTVTEQQLLEHVSTLLPEHMVPDDINLLDTLPRSANGKLDRAALAEHAAATPAAAEDSAFVPPADEIEERIAQLWQEMLGVPKVGRDQNFYALGGDSLLLSQMVGKLRDRVPEVADIEWQELLRDMLRNPTVAALAARRHRGQAPTTPADEQTAVRSLGGEPGHQSGTWVLVHGGTGTLSPYDALLPHLRQAHPGPLLGLEVADPEKYLDLAAETVIARQAADYAKELLDRDSRFRIIGYSVGGLLAAEIARDLTEAGATVDELTVIGSYQPPAVHDELLTEYIFAQSIGIDPATIGFPSDTEAVETALRTILDRSPDQVPAGALTGLNGESAPLAAKFRELAAVPRADRLAALHTAATSGTGPYRAGELPLDEFRRQFDIFAHNLRAMGAHRAEPYFGPVRVLSNSGTATLMGTRAEVDRFWSRIGVGALVIDDIPGDHLTSMSANHAATVAARITAPFSDSVSERRA